jgi:hypothetical protein
MLGTKLTFREAVAPIPRFLRRYFVPVRIETIIAEQLREAGISAKHLGDFLTAHRLGQWSEQRAWDYWGGAANRQPAQPFNPGDASRMQALASVLPPGTAAMPDFGLFATEVKNYTETIRFCLYDNLPYPAAGTLDLLFFQNTPGAGRNVTNMFQGGALPGNTAFLVSSIGINPKPSPVDVASGAAFAQWQAVLTMDNNYKFVISSKEYFSCNPIAFLPPGFGIGSVSALAAVGTHANSGSPDKKASYVFDIPLGILPTRTFNGEAQWGTLRAVTTGSTTNPAVAAIENFLDGFLFRAVQ